ncbi:hypothetical protein [Rhodococcoides corynebacterioides]|uniref:Uncharacterized protein n=1 Tax=Rhodococcoides corynebacterioides TaxID=53972 RepID=A0ABS7P3M4_9NOCA|nr:hypothetical protein [Rhodococcus corynebacterioides]MBY6366985.1 hypothetical protein [Rhodococcus corynebacterioides]MBY6407246.1 hypothetical protein [Rhodococcus corynebacterioides]
MSATRTPTSKGAGTSGGASAIQLALVLGFIALVAAAYGALRAGHALTGTGASTPGNPFQALIEVATGKLVWPTVSTVLLVLGALAVLALVFLVGYLRRQRRGPSASIDARAKLMASPSQLTGVTGKQARDKARRLRPELAEVTDRNFETRDIGVVVGRTVVGRKDVFMSWEDVLLAVAGPSLGKTAALATNALSRPPGLLSSPRTNATATTSPAACGGSAERNVTTCRPSPTVTGRPGTASGGRRCTASTTSSPPLSSPRTPQRPALRRTVAQPSAA